MTELTAPVGIGTANPVAALDIGGATAGAGGTFSIQEPASPTTITTPAPGSLPGVERFDRRHGRDRFIKQSGWGKLGGTSLS